MPFAKPARDVVVEQNGSDAAVTVRALAKRAVRARSSHQMASKRAKRVLLAKQDSFAQDAPEVAKESALLVQRAHLRILWARGIRAARFALAVPLAR